MPPEPSGRLAIPPWTRRGRYNSLPWCLESLAVAWSHLRARAVVGTSRRLGLKWKSEILPGVWSETESVARTMVVDHAPVRACHWTEHGRAWSEHPRIARAQVDGNLHPQKVALFELLAN